MFGNAPHPVAFCAALAALSCGSKSRETAPPKNRDARAPMRGDGGTSARSHAIKPTPAPREVRRDLLREAPRAELDAGGLLIEAGSADLHKYTRGAWESGWSRNRDIGGTQAASVSRRAWLDVELPRQSEELVLVGRGGGLSVAVDGRKVAKVSLGADWTTARVTATIAAGRHRVRLSGKNVDIDRIWFANSKGAAIPAPGRVESSGLRAGERDYHFYLVASEGSQLEFIPQGEAGSTFRVRAEIDGSEPRVLWEGESSGKVVQVPLDDIAGKAARLSLSSGAGTASWTSPQITVAPGEVSPFSKPRNLIVLLIDTARADVFAPFAPDGGIGADHLDGLAAESTVFRNAYNNENWTKPSIATSISGVYPTTHDARYRTDRVPSDLVVLSEHLKANGIATGAFVSNLSAGAKFGFNQGWDVFKKTQDASDAFGHAIDWLDKNRGDSPFYLYIQTIDPHVPYDVPRKFSEPFHPDSYGGKIGESFVQSEEDAINAKKMRISDADREWIIALYKAEILYHDHFFGEFLAALQEREVLVDTAIVILNDHGEEFGEHGRFGHGWIMYDAQYRSPLILHYPPAFPAQKLDEIVEHVDLATTMTDLLGLDAIGDIEGESLLPLVRGQKTASSRPYYALLFGRPKRRAIRVDRWKLIVDAGSRQELYDVETSTAETEDLAASHPIALRLCEVHLGEGLANPSKAKRLADRSDIRRLKKESIRD